MIIPTNTHPQSREDPSRPIDVAQNESIGSNQRGSPQHLHNAETLPAYSPPQVQRATWKMSLSNPLSKYSSSRGFHDDGVVRQPAPNERDRVHNQDQESTRSSSAGHSRAKLCVVCGKHPQYSKGKNHYPTCGLTCAAELKSRGDDSKQMCVVCGVRRRHSPYPTCGLTCGAKLESGGVLPNPSDRDSKSRSFNSSSGHQRQDVAVTVPPVTCSACLMCWRASKQPASDFCGSNCMSTAENQAVLLLEAPQGHTTYHDVSQQFRNSWKTSVPCPEVLKVYKIVERAASVLSYQTFRNKMSAKGQSLKSQATESTRWYGTTRECDLGEPDYERFCRSSTCMLCSTIQNSFSVPTPAKGIHTSATSSRSDIHSGDTRKPLRKTMVLTEVTSGKEIGLTREEVPRERPHDYDSVQIISRSNVGQVSPQDDLIVYSKDAIRPLYLVFYN